MKTLYNALYLKERRRRLRRDQTLAERIIWGELRRRQLCGYKFYRQYSIGPFIADFYCSEGRLVVELDGPYHFYGNTPAYDAARTEYITSLYIRVIRFKNEEVFNNLPNVLLSITKALEEKKR